MNLCQGSCWRHNLPWPASPCEWDRSDDLKYDLQNLQGHTILSRIQGWILTNMKRLEITYLTSKFLTIMTSSLMTLSRVTCLTIIISTCWKKSSSTEFWRLRITYCQHRLKVTMDFYEGLSQDIRLRTKPSRISNGISQKQSSELTAIYW